jgi:hypothetical protein
MARLVAELRGANPGKDKSALLALAIDKGYVAPKESPSTKWQIAGWMEEMTDLRNEFVHRRTYGLKQAERRGQILPVDAASGLYRYTRPLVWAGTTSDVYDVIVSHYKKMNALLFESAQKSGYDTSMPHITDNDIIEISEDTPSSPVS